jgi:NTE family protein
MPTRAVPSRPRAPRASASPAPGRARGAARRAAGQALSLDLALQGGGSHGAFTWGVLDRLLQDETLVPAGVSGTSAGAMNAAVLATGFARGGHGGAREALAAFWRDIATTGSCFGNGVAEAGTPAFEAAFPWLSAWPWADAWSRSWREWAWTGSAVLSKFASPYQFNPLGLNPLREVVARHVSEKAMREGPLRVFVTATAVHTGQPEVFSGERLSHEALLASACLPHLFHAVEIGGVPYWDGGYTGNPAIWPLIYDTEPLDVLLIKINPLRRDGTPDTPMEIADRVSEITFNAGLVGELRAIAFVQRLLREQRLDPGHYKGLRLHMVHDEDGLAPLGASSKLNTDWDFLQSLHALGVAAAERWLAAHRADLGVRPTLDVASTFLARRAA